MNATRLPLPLSFPSPSPLPGHHDRRGRLLQLAALLVLATLHTACPQFPDDAAHADAGADAALPDTGPAETRECMASVLLSGAEGAQTVTIAGEFNDWDIEATPLTRQGGAWRGELELSPGYYGYKFVVDGQYEGDPPPDVYTKWVGGIENRKLTVPDCNVPSWKVVDTGVTAGGLVTATLKFQSAASGAPIDPASVRVRVGGKDVTARIDAATGQVTIAHQAAEHGKHSLVVHAADTDGTPVESSPLWIPLWWEAEPFTWQDALMYLIFTDRFRDGDGQMPLPPIEGVPAIANYNGGDFRGVTDAIEEGYFDDLGVNLLWLSPINENTDRAHGGSDPHNQYTGYHGYWTTDPLRAEARYGTGEPDGDARLQELVEAAHARGIRVMFDLVLNHVHEDHVYCAEEPAWCTRTCVCGEPGCAWEGPEGRPRDCQFAAYLPDLDYRNHPIVERVVEDVLALMKKFDVDAIRIDAAKHMDHVIMRTIRLRLNELEAAGAAPFYVVGETYTGEDGHDLIMKYVADYELHGQFDFPLLYPIRQVFGRDGSFRHLEARTRLSEQKYGDTLKWHSPFLGNHDIPRFVSEALGNVGHPFGGTPDLMAQGPADSVDQWNIINRMSMGFAFLLSLPGIPLIYYGDEVGLAGGPDPDNRRRMPWEWNANQRELLARVQTLGRARRDVYPLRHGARQELWLDDTFYVFARDAGNGDVAIVAMNKGAETRTESVQIPAAMGVAAGRTLRSVTSERSVTVAEGAIQVTLDPWEYAIFH